MAAKYETSKKRTGIHGDDMANELGQRDILPINPQEITITAIKETRSLRSGTIPKRTASKSNITPNRGSFSDMEEDSSTSQKNISLSNRLKKNKEKYSPSKEPDLNKSITSKEHVSLKEILSGPLPHTSKVINFSTDTESTSEVDSQSYNKPVIVTSNITNPELTIDSLDESRLKCRNPYSNLF
ncbi:hypothetical protein WN55_07743 [Dufourea novaeangliae]|uniref:Uncharacterized protein n=1 Tax=Dufourea novaeangliae TaxID=178035 RepID=A0A154P654_DUFNO|nr:hypothetical protein WN55_07743 [Dufourea novaeangliae]